MSQSDNKLSLRHSLTWIVLSILFIFAPVALGLSFYRYIRDQRTQSADYTIQYIVSDPSEGPELSPDFLMELLDLSQDLPQNLYRFSTRDAVDKLKTQSLIEEAHIHKIVPGILSIQYRLREPIALLGDYSNTVIDRNGIPFPWKPFYPHEELSVIYLGLRGTDMKEDSLPQSPIWGQALQGRRINLAIQVLEYLQNILQGKPVFIHSVDVSQAFALSYGQKEIVVRLEEKSWVSLGGTPVAVHFPRLLRLSLHHYPQELANYQNLSYHLQKQSETNGISRLPHGMYGPQLVVDLRIPQLAFLSYPGD